MYLIHVYPLLKGVAPPSLTYFSRTSYPRGACVRVRIRSKEVFGIVHTAEPAHTARARVRGAAHTLSNLRKQTPTFFFTKPLITAVEALSKRCLLPPGVLFELFLPNACASSPKTYPKLKRLKPGSGHMLRLAQLPQEEQAAHLNTLVREYLAHKRSVLIVTENRHEAAHAHAVLSSGFDASRVFLIHGGISKGTLLRTWVSALENTQPVILVASTTYVAIPRHDIGGIIVLGSSSPNYRRDVRPLFDVRVFLREYAQALSVPLVSCDTILDPTDHILLAEGRANEDSPFVWSGHDAVPYTTIDMRDEKDPILSRALIHSVERVLSNGESVCIMSGRKGIAGSVVCGDCGTAVSCAHCEAPLSLVGPSGTISVPRLFCRRCGHERDSRERCSVCTSWRLMSLGAGSELYESLLKKRFPKTPILRIDLDTAPTDARARLLAEKANSVPSVTIATERATPFLAASYTSVIYASIDALLSVPEYDVTSKILRLTQEGHSRAKKLCVIQTRLPNHPIVEALATHSLKSFIDTECALRKTLRFPPYATLIHIARVGAKHEVQNDIAALARTLGSHHKTYITPYQNRTARGSKITVVIDGNTIDETTRSIIQDLPPAFLVEVDCA